jgi:hypothetical protein
LKRLICCIMTSWILSLRIYIPIELMEREDRSRKMDHLKYWVSHSQLMEWVFIYIFWVDNMKEWEIFKFGTQLIHEWQEHERTKVARSGIDFDTTKGAHRWTGWVEETHMIKSLGPSCDWWIHTMCYFIRNSSIDKGRVKQCPMKCERSSTEWNCS